MSHEQFIPYVNMYSNRWTFFPCFLKLNCSDLLLTKTYFFVHSFELTPEFSSLLLHSFIVQMRKWRPKKYSFVFAPIGFTSLVRTHKIQKKYSFRTRLVGRISTKTKEYFFDRHLCIRSISILIILELEYTTVCRMLRNISIIITKVLVL